MNNVNLVGRLVKDPEIRHNNKGLAILSGTVAVNRKYKKDETDFIRFIAFNKTAELISQYFKKGSQIGITGRIQTGSYDDKDGKKVYTSDVVIDNITFIDSKKNYDPTETLRQEIEKTKKEVNPYEQIGLIVEDEID